MHLISSLFSNSYLHNIDNDFYLSLGICFFVMIIMNIIFWILKPQNNQ